MTGTDVHHIFLTSPKVYLPLLTGIQLNSVVIHRFFVVHTHTWIASFRLIVLYAAGTNTYPVIAQIEVGAYQMTDENIYVKMRRTSRSLKSHAAFEYR